MFIRSWLWEEISVARIPCLAAADGSPFWCKSFCLKYSMDNLFNDHHRLESEEAASEWRQFPTRHLPWNSVKATRSFRRAHWQSLGESEREWFFGLQHFMRVLRGKVLPFNLLSQRKTFFRYFTARNWEIMQKNALKTGWKSFQIKRAHPFLKHLEGLF